MTIRTLLSNYIEKHDPFPGALTFDQWRQQKWVKVRIGKQMIPIFPVGPIRDLLHKHDIHHVITNYSTTWEGEFELAAWEVASGGCRLNLLFWADRISFLIMGLILFPKSILKALRRGWRARNLYRMNFSEILEMEEAELYRLLRLQS